MGDPVGDEATEDHCEDGGLEVVHGHCILMFAEPTASFHKFHRWVWGLLGKIPKQ